MHGKPRLRIQEIFRLTDAEIALNLDQDLESPRLPHGGTDLGQMPGGTDAGFLWWRGLSMREKVERLRRRWREECCG